MENIPDNLNFGFPLCHKNEEKFFITKSVDATLYNYNKILIL